MAAMISAFAPMMDAVIVHERISTTAERVAADLKAENSEIRVVPPEEYKEAAASLAESFVDDHVMRYAIDTPDSKWDDKERWAVYVQMMEYITYATCIEGLVTTVGPDYDCVALWNPPDVDLDNMILMFRSGIWRLHYQLTSEGRERYFNEFQPLLASALDDVLGDRSRDCWYLNYIGTKPSSRGHGYAKKLIRNITDRADREGRATYLESSHDVNLIIYGKLGFRNVRQVYLERDEERIKMDVMVREPVKSKSEESN